MTSFILEQTFVPADCFCFFIYYDNTWKEVCRLMPELVSKQISIEQFYGYFGIKSKHSNFEIPSYILNFCFFPLSLLDWIL